MNYICHYLDPIKTQHICEIARLHARCSLMASRNDDNSMINMLLRYIAVKRATYFIPGI